MERLSAHETALELDQIYNIDCLDGLKMIPDKSVDMILTDLPYGTTNCRWDTPIPLQDYVVFNGRRIDQDEFMLHAYKSGMQYEAARDWFDQHKKTGLWSQYLRIIKDHGAILLFSQSPFDKTLGHSNLALLRYEWIWEKTLATGHLNANKMPMKAHENILVFYKKLPIYHPQKTTGHEPVHAHTKYVKTQNNTQIYGRMNQELSGGGSTQRYPRDVITFASDKQTSYLHPTQKPLALCRYMIRTYTNPGNIVLDSCCGSGTIPLAAKLEGRHFIAMDNGTCDITGKPWAEISKERISSFEAPEKGTTDER